MTRPERPLRSGDEYDAFTGWRRVLGWRPGELARIKRRYWRRTRRAARRALTQSITFVPVGWRGGTAAGGDSKRQGTPPATVHEAPVGEAEAAAAENLMGGCKKKGGK